MKTIGDVCPDAKSSKCSGEGCKVQLEKSFVVYCGEIVRDHIIEKKETTLKMFDCIIIDSGGSKMSAVELKHRKGGTGVLKGKGKAGNVDAVRKQFADGLIVLRKVLERMAKSCICLQLVLYTKTQITDRSELKQLKKKLYNTPQKVTITTSVCGNKLPEKYVTVSVQELPS